LKKILNKINYDNLIGNFIFQGKVYIKGAGVDASWAINTFSRCRFFMWWCKGVSLGG